MSCAARKNAAKTASGVRNPAIASAPLSAKRWPIPSQSTMTLRFRSCPSHSAVSMAFPRMSTSSAIWSSVMISGGDRAMVSPVWRAIRPPWKHAR